MNQSKNVLGTYKHYTLLVVLFYTVLFVNDVVLYKLVQFGSIQFSASSIIYPATYLIADVITEVYGYDLTRKLIWQSLIINIIFSILIGASLYLPSPADWKLQDAFSEVFKNITIISITHAIIAPLSYFINAYLLSKWKIMTKGKYFCLRSASASLIGELSFSIMMAGFIWYGHTLQFIIMLMVSTYTTKFIWAILGTYPASLIVYYLKKSEEVDIYDCNTNFNPFLLTQKNSEMI